MSGEASRRLFLKTSAAAIASAAAVPAVHAAGSDAVRTALVGCGGRGSGAAVNALSAPTPIRLVALADIFEDRLNGVQQRLAGKYGQKVDAPPDRCFLGFDAYRKAIDAVSPGGLVILGTPPAFRPLHLEYAVEKGVHVFMEKSFGVDAPGVRRVMKAGEAAARKNLKIAGGLMSRHNPALEELMKRIADGAIGDIITAWAYRMHDPVGFSPRRPGESELAHQIRNYNSFTWTNGSFILDWMIHDLDVCCWAKNAWPVSAQGMGGRQTRTQPDQNFDHMAVEYHFADGSRMLAQGRHMAGTWGFFANLLHGTKGSALLGVVGEASSRPRLFGSWVQNASTQTWQGHCPVSPYQLEFDHLLDSIVNDKPHNETDRCARACITSIMGRMAFESGQFITLDQALNSKAELAPGLDTMTWESAPPVAPDTQGNYPIARPGVTKPA